MFIDANLLKDAVTALVPVIPSRCSYPVLEYVLMTPDGAGLALRATDREVSALIRLPVECDFSTCMPGKFIGSLLGAIGDEKVEITYSARLCKLVVDYWLGKATVNCIDAADFPAYRDHAEWKELDPISGAQMTVIGNQVAFAADTKDLNTFRYVGFDGQQVYATDKAKLSFALTADSKPMMFVPAYGLRMAGRFFAECETIRVFVDLESRELRFVAPSREMSFELGTAKPHDLSAFNPTGFTGQVALSSNDLVQAMAQLRTVAHDCVRIDITPSMFTLHCQGDSLGATVALPAPSTGVLCATCSYDHLSKIIASFGKNRQLQWAWKPHRKNVYLVHIFEDISAVQCVLPVLLVEV